MSHAFHKHVYTIFNQTPARSGYTAQAVGGWSKMPFWKTHSYYLLCKSIKYVNIFSLFTRFKYCSWINLSFIPKKFLILLLCHDFANLFFSFKSSFHRIFYINLTLIVPMVSLKGGLLSHTGNRATCICQT